MRAHTGGKESFMQQKSRRSNFILIGTMLFGMFFGAGNLIFPIYMGQQAGSIFMPALLGFFMTAIGLPFMGVLAIGLLGTGGVRRLADRVHPWFGTAFSVALYLTIGPLFAIPRTATVPFTVGIEPLISSEQMPLFLGIFSLVFFALVCRFSLKPARIIDVIGKRLTPAFLAFLSILILASVLKPMGAFQAPQGSYVTEALVTGFKEGYNTMDALASLAFGIVIIQAMNGLGISEPAAVAKTTIKSGAFAMGLMMLIYALIAFMGASSVGTVTLLANGGQVFAAVARHYFGSFGAILLGLIIVFACLKTSIALVTSCGAFFHEMFPRLGYRFLVIFLSALSFSIANVGLNNIIAFAVPVLMLLYPLAIVLILLALLSPLFKHSRSVYLSAMMLTLCVSLIDGYSSLAKSVPAASVPLFESVSKFYADSLPLYHLGLGWILPALLGALIGLLLPFASTKGHSQVSH